MNLVSRLRYNILYLKQRASYPPTKRVCLQNYQIISKGKITQKYHTGMLLRCCLKKVRMLGCCAINDIDISANFDSNTAK